MEPQKKTQITSLFFCYTFPQPYFYLNFYFTNNKIILPKFNVKEDYEVETIFQNLFPTKEIVMIETSNINYGGGNIHCITMNVPKI